jgi:hypothetical protein
MGVLLHEVFPAWFGLIIWGWPIYAYGLSAIALYKALRNRQLALALIFSLLVLLPSLFLTWILVQTGKGGIMVWSIFVAAPLFMSAAAFSRNLYIWVTGD